MKKTILYQGNGWCTQIQDSQFPDKNYYNYSYNADGTISKVTSWAGVDEYVYDNFGRLRSWSNTPVGGSKVTEDYTYDAIGNLTRKGSKSYSYDESNQITTSGFAYDHNGNLTSDGTYNYSYDAENKLIQVNKVLDGSLVATYTYYHDGLRKSKTVGGVTTNYSWDASGNLVQESDGNGNTLASYYYAGKDNLIGFKKNGVTYIYHTNLRGDVVSVTDESGAIQVQYSYDPWGNVKSTDGTLVQPFRYAGYYSDDETGLYYLKSRYYSPNLGRFLTRDDYGYIDYTNPQTLNLYSYAGNNPVSNVDPSGNWTQIYIENGNLSVDTYDDETNELIRSTCVDMSVIDENFESIQNLKNSGLRPELMILVFYYKVRNHGEWDYKQFGTEYADLGNFNYGFAGSALGLSPEILLKGAGWAQGRAGTSRPQWGNWYDGPPYGDDPNDQEVIQAGINYYYNYY